MTSWKCLARLILDLHLVMCAEVISDSTNLNSGLKQMKIQDSVETVHRQEINSEWQCPNISNTRSLECGCDIPHTLRCSGDVHGLEVLAENLRMSPNKISLLDCTLRNVTFLSNARIFENISLHGLVISSGEMKRIHKLAFAGIGVELQALGLPSNGFLAVPKNSISYLTSLERLDLSNNKIKSLGPSDFSLLANLSFLDISDNEITSISTKTFGALRKLATLKLGGNRLGEYPESLLYIGLCYNLRDLDLRSNSITGALTSKLLPKLSVLESLNLERNLIKSIQNKALENLTNLKLLSLCHNQIDVLQDHAFYGLSQLEHLDLSYNGIVAVSSLSLQHLPVLKTLDLTHNFLRYYRIVSTTIETKNNETKDIWEELMVQSKWQRSILRSANDGRALTSDLTLPLPSLQELRLDGNDISIVAKNALGEAKELRNLLLNENPLSCDCSLVYFSEWLQTSKLPVKDLMTPTCATPPHLEGAPLFQVPANSLVCDTEDIENDEQDVVRRPEVLSRSNNLTNVKDLSGMIFLTNFHFSTDYGLILTWIVNLKHDYACDAIFVYKEENIHEILIDDSSIHCESKVLNGKNTVSVIVPSSSILLLGESYRFCLVLIQQTDHMNSELEIGCSNIIKLQTDDQLGEQNSLLAIDRKAKFSPMVPSVEESTSRNIKISEKVPGDQPSHSQRENPPYELYGAFNNNFLPGLGLGILIAFILVLLWGATRIRNNIRCTPAVATCYTTNRGGSAVDPERGNRYLKLQATTSL